MYKVSIFKKVTDVSNPFNRDVFHCLERIKSGKSKDIIERIRESQSDDLKKTLPGVCFNGAFSYRNESGLKEKSGLIVLDFDKFDNPQDAKDYKFNLTQDPIVFAAWISPKGKGVKVLVKIPKEGNHKGYFDALKEHFNSDYWDSSGSDVSRFCYESFDSEIYINSDSEIFLKCNEPEIEDIGSRDVVIPMTSDNQIIKNLYTWWNKKYGATKGSRNDNLFKLAVAFNDFGVQKNVAESELLQFSQVDFKESEIKNIIKSAYKKSENFGTKHFENKQVKDAVEKMIRTGKKSKDVEREFNQIPKEIIQGAIEKVKEEISIKDFWYFDDKDKIKLSVHKFKFWLQQNNFLKYFPTNSNTYTFVKVDRNIVEETSEKRIKDFTLEYLLGRGDIGYVPYDFMASQTKYFSSDFLSFLKSSEIEIKSDTKDLCYLYYQNCCLEISKDGFKEIDYIDVDGYVWKNQIIDRDFVKADHHNSEFRTFLWLISGKDVDRYNSLKSVIGYLLHSFKTSANNKAIIFNDETISENPNGGSGKSLFGNAISKMKKVSTIDGKAFDFSKSFPYQTVSTDTQVLIFDDVKKNFSFESLFSLITEGITIEYKGQDAIKLPIEKSPKLLFTTNYTIGGVGGSFERRKFEVELSSYFSHRHTPIDEFGHLLFDDWSDAEWSSFDNYMINCLQYFLENGLVNHEFKNLELRKFIKETSFEFYEWLQDPDNIMINQRFTKAEKYEAFITEFPDYKKWLTQKRFKKWLESIASFYGFEYTEGNSNGARWFHLKAEIKQQS